MQLIVHSDGVVYVLCLYCRTFLFIVCSTRTGTSIIMFYLTFDWHFQFRINRSYILYVKVMIKLLISVVN